MIELASAGRLTEVLAGRHTSDVPMLLAGVIAPVAIIGTNRDLLDSGLSDANWTALTWG
ncbi:hypothetical protein [Streptomyces vinaceus]|uniref:hypothetical protein n=1 Tax=Streptomyces vinaceus TaxID=1960 RepID=UPI00167569C3|nr:hypothetical protein [Streptomyces vinaceus]GHE73806.1 hypothetical protein GCM10017778_68970 [Streptomyces vinaceus]